jgi:hypothetical protein
MGKEGIEKHEQTSVFFNGWRFRPDKKEHFLDRSLRIFCDKTQFFDKKLF